MVDGKVQFGVEVTQKVPYWFHLKTGASRATAPAPTRRRR